jgi:hypothetical protein
MTNWERILTLKDLQHEKELDQMEHELAEYFGLKGEGEIRREQDLLRALKTFKLLGLEGWGYRPPPPMRRLFPNAVTDWDFATSNWSLNTSIYVSSPSSLLITSFLCIAILCKYAGTYPLDQGRIVTQIRLPAVGDIASTGSYVFRYNRAAGSPPVVGDDHYVLLEQHNGYTTFDPTRATLRYYAGGAGYDWAIVSYLANGAPPQGAWDQRRITWWVSGGLLIVRLERYYGGAWIQAINDITDANNRFTGNPDRREGPGPQCQNVYFDDTEIWGP